MRNPPLTSRERVRAERNVFSLRLMSGTAAWPSRSSGATQRPRFRRSGGRRWPMGAPSSRIASRCTGTSPDSASVNSSWPLPATPATPRISPARRSKEMSWRSTPNCFAAGSDRPRTVSRTSPGFSMSVAGGFSSCPIIISARLFDVSSRGSQIAETLPCRRMVAAEQSDRISSSLCEM